MEFLALQLPYGQLNLLLTDDHRILEVQSFESKEGQVGSIFVGRVDQVKKNINSAFVSIDGQQKVFLSLDDLKTVFYVKKTGKGDALVQGDEILIQIEREAYANKLARASAAVSLSGRYAVLTTDKQGVFVSSKIDIPNYRKSLKNKLKPYLKNRYGIIVRTNAKDVPYETLVEEISSLTQQMEAMLEHLPYKALHQLIYEPINPTVRMIRDLKGCEQLKVITNMASLERGIKAVDWQPMEVTVDQQTSLALETWINLHNIKESLNKLFLKRVWLKSGATIVIEPTEAMTVIDVNTEKTISKSNSESTVLKTNLEAGIAIAKEIRARNLSGIIIVDFIDMLNDEDKDTLIKHMTDLCQQDPIKTTVHGLTTLGLMEITRKKLEKPLDEQIIIKKFLNKTSE